MHLIFLSFQSPTVCNNLQSLLVFYDLNHSESYRSVILSNLPQFWCVWCFLMIVQTAGMHFGQKYSRSDAISSACPIMGFIMLICIITGDTDLIESGITGI